MIRFRNSFSLHATSRPAGPMKHRCQPRGGARNGFADCLDELVNDYDFDYGLYYDDHECDDSCFAD